MVQLNDRQKEIDRLINGANSVFVRVSGTEFDVKVSKTEAKALNRHMSGNLSDNMVGNESGDLYLEGIC